MSHVVQNAYDTAGLHPSSKHVAHSHVRLIKVDPALEQMQAIWGNLGAMCDCMSLSAGHAAYLSVTPLTVSGFYCYCFDTQIPEMYQFSAPGIVY